MQAKTTVTNMVDMRPKKNYSTTLSDDPVAYTNGRVRCVRESPRHKGSYGVTRISIDNVPNLQRVQPRASRGATTRTTVGRYAVHREESVRATSLFIDLLKR